ncbi:MAG: 16S rRNA (cytosine(1402)-N(4))-methyltransferase RsmH [Bacteroidia bacterium]|nr:MAG: 16S rRNA (cytosine(1402)-N(4))-methyltransferase RsmH [Bacteroidia bacterium]
MMMHDYHKPVLLKEAIDGLDIREGGVYVDATFGGGGHSRSILKHLAGGRLIAFDQDEDAIVNVPDDERIHFLHQNFRYMKNFLKYYGYLPVDGILADLGVSSHQLNEAERGFSSRYEGPLDMRMSQSSEKTAKNILNKYDAESLSNVFFLYGEIRQAKKLAEAVVLYRQQRPLETTSQLIDILKPMVPAGRENKFFARVFQALRIEVNGELDALKALLIQSNEVLKTGGRLVVISYHSLEDRLVKNFMKAGNFEGKQEKDFFGRLIAPFKPVTKMITPGEQELRENPRSRSAKLRIAEKNQ